MELHIMSVECSTDGQCVCAPTYLYSLNEGGGPQECHCLLVD